VRFQRKGSRAGRDGGAPDYVTLRRIWIGTVVAVALAAKLRPCALAAHFAFVWHEPDRHRDPDGVSSGGRKLILDGLVRAKVLSADGVRNVRGFVGEFFKYKGEPGYRGPGVHVVVGQTGDDQSLWIPHRLPDANEMRAAVEVGVRRQLAHKKSGQPLRKLCARRGCGFRCGPGDRFCRKHGGDPLACRECGDRDCPGHVAPGSP